LNSNSAEVTAAITMGMIISKRKSIGIRITEGMTTITIAVRVGITITITKQ
jgi:hypothetical protein